MPDVRLRHPSIRVTAQSCGGEQAPREHQVPCGGAHSQRPSDTGAGPSPGSCPAARHHAFARALRWRSNTSSMSNDSPSGISPARGHSGTTDLLIAFCCGHLQRASVGCHPWRFGFPKGFAMGHHRRFGVRALPLQNTPQTPRAFPSAPLAVRSAASRNQCQAQAAQPNPGMQRTRCARR
jgi:hypothetical protein